MNGVSIGIVALCIGLAGCGGGNRDAEDARQPANDPTTEGRPTPVSQTGCLTARGDQFVLTDLERGAGDSTTETFQLIGNDEDLRQHVGKQVRVTGEADAPRVANLQESTPPAADTQPQGTAGGADPKVSTQTRTRLEVRKLNVTSVEPTGEACAAETTGGGA